MIRNSAPTPLEVATTYDPATPYRGALRLARDLGNVRLLTMRGDGHTAYGGNSPCIDAAVEAYLLPTCPRRAPPAAQAVPFEPPPPAVAASAQGQARALGPWAPYRRSILR